MDQTLTCSTAPASPLIAVDDVKPSMMRSVLPFSRAALGRAVTMPAALFIAL